MAERSAVPTDRADAASDQPEGLEVIRPPSRDPLIPEGMPETVPRSVRGVILQSRVFAGLALLFLVLAIFFFAEARELRSAEAERNAVLDAGEVVGLRVTTFEGATIDAWVEDVQSLATGSYADEVAQVFDATVRQGLADNEVVSVGEVLNSFVQEVDGDRATVFVVLRQTYTNAAQPRSISDELRMEIRLTRIDGDWLASEVAVLGPSVITPVEDAVGDGTGATAEGEETG